MQRYHGGARIRAPGSLQPDSKFEQFVAALGREDRCPKDSHWRPQAELLGDVTPALDHVGRTGTMGETLGLRGENLSHLPCPEGSSGEETVRLIREYYADDYRQFGYAEPQAATASEDEARWRKVRTSALIGLRRS